MIGMFVATLPYRIQLRSHWSFDELVKHVRDRSLSILEHSHYPLQQILADFHQNQSSVSFLETMFDFITISSDAAQLSFDETTLEGMPSSTLSEVAKFDFNCTFLYNPLVDDGQVLCRFVCSRELYDQKTIAKISRRFQHLLQQLFTSQSTAIHNDQSNIPMSKLSLILLDEADEIQGTVFHRRSDVINEGMFCLRVMFDEGMQQ